MINHIYKLLSLVALTTLLLACRTQRTTEPTEIVVTIAPLKYIVEQITGDDFQVGVLVPTGASPETFEPTPKQIITLGEAELVFSTGLIGFENALTHRIEEQRDIIHLAHGIELIAGSCSHNHTTHTAEHHHGIDPHIWTSPQELKIMARNAYEAIIQQYPDSIKYTSAYHLFDHRLDSLDNACRRMCEASDAKAFVVYHPALTYFARAYGIEQIAIEDDGKEPSAKHIANIIASAKSKSVKCLLYQTQYPRSTVEIIARDMGIECREFNPLEEDVVKNISHITRCITEQ